MAASVNNRVNMVLKFVGKDIMHNVDSYVNEVILRNFMHFISEEQISLFFEKYMDNFYLNHSYNDISNIRYYTGIAFNSINSILRGVWDYEKNGELTAEKRNSIIELANSLSDIIETTSVLSSNITVYRGVSLDSFMEYGITSINDLEQLVGQYYYESGFTSTSLLRDKSFFDRQLEWHEPCNIEIEYLIPEEFNDGLPLINSDLSYSKEQNEFLINKGSLSKIVEVKISEDGSKAYLRAVMIPKKMWDMSFAYKQEQAKSRI